MNKVTFEHSNDYETTLSLSGGSLELINVMQIKIYDCKFDRQSSLMVGGAILLFQDEYENKTPGLQSYIADSDFNGCQSGSGGAVYF